MDAGFLGIGGGELLVIVVLAAILLGPEKLPPLIKKVGRVVRFLNSVANDATQKAKDELGPELEGLADLRPDKLLKDATAGLPDPQALTSMMNEETAAMRAELASLRTQLTRTQLIHGEAFTPPPTPQTPRVIPTPIAHPTPELQIHSAQ
ncbi:MAG: twin-arginine translocase TatA/TatE family subunit [Cellulomonadaceae bacterium]|jgi:sec-independent protein translocase protein TatB|nr:twin-arginine translocase TatA/TatE family subunit [Cellulomonadaceae bacterium]